LFSLWYRTYLQKKAIHPPLKTFEERKALFDNVKGEIIDAENYISEWFHGARVD
jgi:hypothetical protein